MVPTYPDKTPQAFLDVLEKVLAKRNVLGFTYLYLLEYDKPTVDRHPNQINIEVKEVVATPVKALRWDYLIGEDTINNREFIIADSRHAEYLVDLHRYRPGDQSRRGSLRVNFYKFELRQVEPHLIRKHHLEDPNFKERLDLHVIFSPLEISEVITNTIKHIKYDRFLNNLLKELIK
jgi:hypothetical protein